MPMHTSMNLRPDDADQAPRITEAVLYEDEFAVIGPIPGLAGARHCVRTGLGAHGASDMGCDRAHAGASHLGSPAHVTLHELGETYSARHRRPQ